MKNMTTFLYEWKHFVRSPFKMLALLLFIVASVYGLHKGAHVFQKQRAEVAKMKQKVEEERQIYLSAYQEGLFVPEDRPWVDMRTPLWAIEYAWVYHYKVPSPAMVYSIGQSEQYGFIKKITRWASPYDTDLAEEIANPERLQTGTLDFSFALLFLSPLLLLVLVYNIQSMETEQGFMPLIEVQNGSKRSWLVSRMMFYVLLLCLVNVLLISYGATLTGVEIASSLALGQVILYSFAYVAFWSLLYFLILQGGKSISENTLKMVGMYLIFAFIIPATVSQYLSIRRPASLMTAFLDAKLDKRWDIWDQPTYDRQAQLVELFPEIADSPLLRDTTKLDRAIRESTSALENQLQKASIRPVEEENEAKNTFIKRTFWFNPVSFFQNRFNSVAQTHYDDYQNYRDEIQQLVDVQIQVLILDMWADKKVDEEQYVKYYEILRKLEK
ncbi:MAG: hypothetical protein AAF135_05090 [Bacteroidota bacterium]